MIRQKNGLAWQKLTCVIDVLVVVHPILTIDERLDTLLKLRLREVRQRLRLFLLGLGRLALLLLFDGDRRGEGGRLGAEVRAVTAHIQKRTNHGPEIMVLLKHLEMQNKKKHTSTCLFSTETNCKNTFPQDKA